MRPIRAHERMVTKRTTPVKSEPAAHCLGVSAKCWYWVALIVPLADQALSFLFTRIPVIRPTSSGGLETRAEQDVEKNHNTLYQEISRPMQQVSGQIQLLLKRCRSNIVLVLGRINF